MKGYGIEFGALCDDIEVQLQRQGCTLGDQAERVQRWANEISSLRIHGLLTQAESDRARRRLWKELTRAVKPLLAGRRKPGTPHHRINTMKAFKIETLTADGWSDDASLLGFGANQDDNRWPTRAAALAACVELSTVLDPTRLRVVQL